MVSNNTLPLLVVFGLGASTGPKVASSMDGEVVDRYGHFCRCYDDVPKILERLKGDGIKIGVTSHNVKMNETMHLLNLFGLDKYLEFADMSLPFLKEQQFQQMHVKSNIQYSDMLFFDDFERNIKVIGEMGVPSVQVVGGMSMALLEYGLTMFAHKKLNLPFATTPTPKVENK